MLIDLLRKSQFLRQIRYPIGMQIVESKYKEIRSYIGDNKNLKILEIGAGTGDIVECLRKDGFKNVVPLDVVNLSFIDGIEPIIYDGKKIPLKNNYFDFSLLVTTLHHCKSPESVLKEAIRVSKKIIVIEEAYKNDFQKYLTFAWDSFMNLEFFGHPHSNKTDPEWRKTFKKLHLKVLGSTMKQSGILLRVSYLLGKN